ncbi:MAG: type VI secretion system tip protein VgrG [Polyangiaceae bacterium]|nr:type VI secretion system tip protein VgrG [Polyangiaceae bacterium]
MSDLITIQCDVLPPNTRVAGFHGVEAISRPYEIEVLLLLQGADSEDWDLDSAVGQKAAVVIDRKADDIPPFVLSGIFASMELLHEYGGRALLRGVIVPKLWTLSLSKHSRMFTKKTVPDIIRTILSDNGLSGSDFELRLKSYPAEEHICQYRESDLDFISRWMEREGIYYFFEHSEGGEKLVISDSAAYNAEEMGKPIRYFPQTGADMSAGPSFRSFTSRRTTLPAKVKLRDYDYTKPNLDVSGTADVAPNGAGEINLYGERFFTPDAGKRLAQIRSEELLARQAVFQATGTRLHVRAGYTFDLEEHPRSAFNTKYLVTEARHYGNQATGLSHFKHLVDLPHEEVYFVEATAIPAKTQFRPEHRTAWPRIYGYENGTICGPSEGDYAQIDDQGRYLVKFKFDESDLANGNASTYVRMMQPHGGDIEGFHFPLRKGTEVVFSFMGGDPDRPVISGVVPNMLTPSPVTSANHTKNVIQTGGRNRLELEDLAGQERITMSTPHTNTYVRMGSPNEEHTMIIHTDGPTLLDAGQNWDVMVGANLNERVTGNTDEVYSGTRKTVVTGNAEEYWNSNLISYINGTTKQTYQGNHEMYSWGTRKDEVGGALTQIYHSPVTRTLHATLNDTITGTVTRTHGATTYTVNGATTHTLNGTFDETVSGAHTITTGARTETVNGNYTQNITGSFSQTTASSADFWTAAKNSRTLGAAYSMNIGAKAALDISASATLGLSAVLALSAGIKLEAKLAIGLSMTAACEIDVASFKFDQKGVKYDTAGCGIKSLGTAIQLAGICLFS